MSTEQTTTEFQSMLKHFETPGGVFLNLLQLSYDMMCVATFDGYFREVSSAWEKRLGWSREELVRAPWIDFIHPEDHQSTWEQYQLLKEGISVTSFENRYLHKSGVYRWLRWNAYSYPNQELIFAVAQDITEERLNQELLLSIKTIQSQYLTNMDSTKLFGQMLDRVLALTQSEYGFIGEVLCTPEDGLYLQTHAITDISWNKETSEFYQKYKSNGLKFSNLNNLFGAVVVEKKPILSNNPKDDPRSGGLPPGHPPLRAFLGLPFYLAGKLKGMIGIANRPNGYEEAQIQLLQPFLSTLAALIEAYQTNEKRIEAESYLKEVNDKLEYIIEERTSELLAIYQNNFDPIVVTDENGLILRVNSATTKLFGYSEKTLLESNISILVPNTYKRDHDSYVRSFVATRKPRLVGTSRKVHAVKSNGSIFPIFLSLTYFESPSHKLYFGGSIKDLSSTHEYTWSYDYRSKNMILDEKLNHLMGGAEAGKEMVLSAFISTYISPQDHSRFADELLHFKEDSPLSTEVRIRNSDRNVAILRLSSEELYSKDGVKLSAFGKAELLEPPSLSRFFDLETKLPNQRLLEHEIKLLLSNNKQDTFAFVYLHSTAFQSIKQQFGSSALYKVLKEIETRAKEHQPNLLFGSLKVDTFLLVVSLDKEQHASKMTSELLLLFVDPFQVEGTSVFVSPELGVSLYPKHGNSPKSLIENARIALQHKAPTSTFHTFTQTLKTRQERQITLKRELRTSLSRNELTLVYQPLVRLNDGKIIGFESLSRWTHPEYGFVSPGEFIPLIENDPLIHEFGKWTLLEACNQIKQWQEQGLKDFYVAVNISAKQFLEENFVSTVKNVLAQTNLNAASLKLEVTETGLISAPELAQATMLELTELGVEFLMDDFGSGYASLTYLLTFPFAGIKIDRSFIDNFTSVSNSKNKRKFPIIKSIIEVGRDLGLTVIAEGVEREREYSTLQLMNCCIAQGYYLSRPLQAVDVPGFIQSHEEDRLTEST